MRKKSKQIKKVSTKSRNGRSKLKASPLLSWKRLAPLVFVVAIVGGLFVYRSFAGGFKDCRAGSGSTGGKYLFMQCYDSYKPVIPDACVMQYSINPGGYASRGLPYEKTVKNQVAEISRISGVPWQYVGTTRETSTSRSSSRKNVVLIDFSAKPSREMLAYRSDVAGFTEKTFIARNKYISIEGSTVNIYGDQLEKRTVSVQTGNTVSTSTGGSLTSKNFESRLGPLVAHELGHSLGLADLYTGGNNQKIIDGSQRMGGMTMPWGDGDRAGIYKSGEISRDLSKCWVPESARKVSESESSRIAENTYAAILGRRPDSSGKLYWQNSLMLGRISSKELVTSIAGSSEAKKRFSSNLAGMSSTDIIKKAYQNSLCRLPSSTELSSSLKTYNKYGFERAVTDVANSQNALLQRINIPPNKTICT